MLTRKRHPMRQGSGLLDERSAQPVVQRSDGGGVDHGGIPRGSGGGPGGFVRLRTNQKMTSTCTAMPPTQRTA
jgi:hypothetical protein